MKSDLRPVDWALITVAGIAWIVLGTLEIALWSTGNRLPAPINTLCIGSLSTYTVVVLNWSWMGVLTRSLAAVLAVLAANRATLATLEARIANAEKRMYEQGYRDRAAAEDIENSATNAVSTLPIRSHEE